MLLDQDTYARGLVRWTPETIAAVKTATRARGDEPITFSGVLSDPTGTISPSPALPNREIGFDIQRRAHRSPPCWVTWDRWFDGDIDCMIFDTSAGKVALADGVPGFGSFSRILVEVPFLNWHDVINIRVHDLVVRFYDDVPADAEPARNSSQEALQGRAGRTHRCIETIVPNAEYLE